MTDITVAEPFPISLIRNRYLLFDVDTITHVRREHNICGVLIGSLPHLSQQNIFLGIPLELAPEEARLLVEQGLAYIVDDVQAHQAGFIQMGREDRLAFLRMMDKQGMETALNAKKKAEEKSQKALQERGLTRIAQQSNSQQGFEPQAVVPEETIAGGKDTSLFESSVRSPSPARSRSQKVEPYYMTPTISHPPLPTPSKSPTPPLPEVPRTYPLFSYLHSKGFFMTPGLRFGCNYTVYPGDPLRFHSHFLATGLDWNEEFELLDIVGGGRLGTGVKKAYLIGGKDPSMDEYKCDEQSSGASHGVKAFSIEWAGL